jgi:hypothetical protein
MKLNNIHNLSMNCNTQRELDEYLKVSRTGIKTKLAAFPYTVLPIYYFRRSKNDPDHTLKYVGLRTYESRHIYIDLDKHDA